MPEPLPKLLAKQFDTARASCREGWRVLLRRGPSQVQFWFIALLIGIAAGFAALFFRLGIEALQAARGATYDAVEATEGGVFAGTRTAVDLVQSLRERFDAERALSRAIHAYLLNSLRLQAAAGTLGVDDLMAVNRLLND